MVQMNVRTRKIGNSIGLILPRNVVDSQGIVADVDLKIMLMKKNPMKNTFGMLRRKKSGQKIKEMIRKDLHE